MDRAELEALDRDTLIAHAEAAGVRRARILTRPELVDEILLRSAKAGDVRAARARGFFGVARDLLARVIERGLNLPDAADRLRSIELPTPPSQKDATPPLPTVTLAEIYAAQGHRDRAIETLEGVLSHEPDHAAAQTLLAQLEAGEVDVPEPKLPPEPEEEPSAVAPDETEEEPAGESDECVAIPVRPGTLFVHWSVRKSTLARARTDSPSGQLALRIVAIAATWDGPRTTVRDYELEAALGDVALGDVPPRAVTRAAIGWRADSSFVPIAHSPSLEAKNGEPARETGALVRWTPSGARPLGEDDPDVEAIARTIARAREAASL